MRIFYTTELLESNEQLQSGINNANTTMSCMLFHKDLNPFPLDGVNLEKT
jgi:hypothetical protein